MHTRVKLIAIVSVRLNSISNKRYADIENLDERIKSREQPSLTSETKISNYSCCTLDYILLVRRATLPPRTIYVRFMTFIFHFYC